VDVTLKRMRINRLIRVGVIGAKGAGKTTLIATMLNAFAGNEQSAGLSPAISHARLDGQTSLKVLNIVSRRREPTGKQRADIYRIETYFSSEARARWWRSSARIVVLDGAGEHLEVAQIPRRKTTNKHSTKDDAFLAARYLQYLRSCDAFIVVLNGDNVFPKPNPVKIGDEINLLGTILDSCKGPSRFVGDKRMRQPVAIVVNKADKSDLLAVQTAQFACRAIDPYINRLQADVASTEVFVTSSVKPGVLEPVAQYENVGAPLVWIIGCLNGGPQKAIGPRVST
jgi:Double-GTPase 2